jgi:protein-S-isoprenylcysteine O-methyltransferase Ste14
MVIPTSLSLVAIGAVLLLSAGDWQWPQAWAYLAEMAITSLALAFWLGKSDPELLTSRQSSPIQKDQGSWDRAFMIIAFAAFLGWLALMGLDARRFHWSEMSIGGEVAGAVLIALCMVVAGYAFHANTFAAHQARAQSQRDHRVVNTGAYAVVRHPMYAGALLFFLGLPLLLGSWCGLFLFPLLAFGLGLRAVGEERRLRLRLTDYDIYTRRVHFRFVPYIW